ncbi:ABC transporter permease [Phycisphaeraceae bacterium D3-23]
MLRLILSRLLQLPVILVIILIVTYAMVWLMPGDPFLQDGAKRPDQATIDAWKAEYNMDRGPVVFMGSYLTGIVTEFNFGESIKMRGVKVSDIIKDGMPVSAALGLAALAVALFLGTLAGVVGALRPKSAWDTASLVTTLIGISLPNFVTGAILLAIGAGLTRLFMPDASFLHAPLGGWSGPANMILPAICLGLAPSAYIARLVRLGLADIMSSDFVRTARAKGLSRHQALFKHALKVAYLPVLSFLGPAAAAAMTGSFVVEKIFNIPGIGQEFVSAVENKDQSVILGVVLVFATILIVFNLIVDLAYAWIDPRIDLT